MRRLRGWILNLADGLGPPPGSVNVNAKVVDGEDELNNTTHQTGTLTRIHETGGSGSPIKADSFGHFGWDMQLSPGRINVAVNPTDPQSEFRKRFPDESSQIGLAYHSDLERLAWTGGRDGLVWNAISGGHDPSAIEWSWNPTDPKSWGSGNWSIASFDANMKLTLRRGVGFVGGALFSIEDGDLQVPVAGADAIPDNSGGGSDRWDLLCLRIETDPTALDYGKQSIEIIQGQPGGGLMAHPGQPTGARRLAMYLLKVAAGATVWSTALDLRRWLWHPSMPMLNTAANYTQAQPLLSGTNASALNTALASGEVILPLGMTFEGQAALIANIAAVPGAVNAGADVRANIYTEARDALNASALGGNQVINSGGVYIFDGSVVGFDAGNEHSSGSLTLNTLRIPSYHRDSNVKADSRTWHRLRWQVQYLTGPGTPSVLTQSISCAVRPVL